MIQVFGVILVVFQSFLLLQGSPASSIAVAALRYYLLGSFPGMDVHMSPTRILTATIPALILFYILHTRKQTRRSQRRFAEENRCEALPKYPHRDSFLGLDYFYESFQALKKRTFLATTCDRYRLMDCATFQSNLLGEWVINTIEPENVAALLKTSFTDFEAGYSRRQTMSELLGGGIFLVDDHQWQRLRNLMRPNFARAIWGDLHDFEVHFTNLLSHIPRDGSTFDIQSLLFSMTLDSASAMFFGKSVDSLGPRPSQSAIAFADSFNQITPIISKRVRLGFLAGILPAPGLKKHCKVVRSFVKECMQNALEHKTSPEAGKPQYTFLDALLQETQDEEEVCDCLLNALLGGRDTTAGFISAIFFVLARRPDVWSKLQQEVAEQFGSEKPTTGGMANMKYLRQVMNEAHRLYPIVPTNQRLANKDTILPSGGGPDGKSPVFVKKGQTVRYQTYAMHRRKDLYGDDADEFLPERWENTPPPWAFLPFSGGPRVCLGQNLAQTEASYTIIRLMQEFTEIEARDSRPWEEGLKITCASGNGVLVAMKPRYCED